METTTDNLKELMQYAYCSSVETLKLTLNLCRNAVLSGVVGDFAEAGVAMGVHPLLMSSVADRKVHLFDSFEGIPIHGEEDKEFVDAYGPSVGDQQKSSGVTSCSIEAVQDFLFSRSGRQDQFVFHKGWFINTFTKLTDEKFSVLRLDCDLYESYVLCFKYLYPRLSKGGYLIIDDHTLSGCAKAMEEFISDKELIIIGDAAYCIK